MLSGTVLDKDLRMKNLNVCFDKNDLF